MHWISTPAPLLYLATPHWDIVMGNAGKTLFAAIAIVVGIVVYPSLKPAVLGGFGSIKAMLHQDGDMKAEIDALRAEAKRKYPGLAESEAMKRVADQHASEILRTGDARTRARAAAEIFFGAYFMNTRARAGYCRRNGVDLTPFVTAYQQVHRADLDRASAILADAGIDPESLPYKIQPISVPAVQQDMEDIARAQNLPMPHVCALFNEKAEALAKAIRVPYDVRAALLTKY
jgi:hypothetical protein